MRTLVVGAGGLLAAAVVREFRQPARATSTPGRNPQGSSAELRESAAGVPQNTGPANDVVALDRRQLDVTDAAGVSRVFSEVQPEIVINCAAYNHVDDAEDNAEAALQVNTLAVLTLSKAAQQSGAALVHYSSDFVFNGETDRPYTEDDAPNPRGVYAASKLLGDWFALEHQPAYVLRVESLFGERGSGGRRGSLGTIVDRISGGEPVPVFVDRTVSPSYTADVARATRALIERRTTPGLYHCVNSGSATWLEIAMEVARLLGVEPRIVPITLETAGLRAPRPKYCALSNAKLQGAGIVMPVWQDALREFLRMAN